MKKRVTDVGQLVEAFEIVLQDIMSRIEELEEKIKELEEVLENAED